MRSLKVYENPGRRPYREYKIEASSAERYDLVLYDISRRFGTARVIASSSNRRELEDLIQDVRLGLIRKGYEIVIEDDGI